MNDQETELTTLLAEPDLPQMNDEGVLDLGSLNGDPVRVHVRAYAQRSPGDWITVTWTRQNPNLEFRRYAYLKDPSQDSPDKEYEIRLQPLWALTSGQYEVSYMVTSRTGNSSISVPRNVPVINTPEPPPVTSTGAVQADFFGTYRPGTIGTWIVPDAYTFTPAAGVLVQSLASHSIEQASTPNTTLSFYRNDDADAFASLVSSDAGTNWTPAHQETVHFARGDLISLKLEGEQNADLFLAVAL